MHRARPHKYAESHAKCVHRKWRSKRNAGGTETYHHHHHSVDEQQKNKKSNHWNLTVQELKYVKAGRQPGDADCSCQKHAKLSNPIIIIIIIIIM